MDPDKKFHSEAKIALVKKTPYLLNERIYLKKLRKSDFWHSMVIIK